MHHLLLLRGEGGPAEVDGPLVQDSLLRLVAPPGQVEGGAPQ